MYKPETYARSLMEALKDGKDTQEKLSRFVSILKHRGDGYLLPRIVAVLERNMVRGAETSVVSRFALTEEARRSIVSFLQKEFGAIGEHSISFATDEHVLGGICIRHKDFLFDATALAMLNQLKK